VGLGRFADAEPLLLPSFGGLKDDPGVALQEKKKMIECIIRLYDAWSAAEPDKGFVEKAAGWRAKLDHLQPQGN